MSRVLPHNLEAEAAVVGGILLYPWSMARVSDLLGADDFHHPTLGAIYQAMLDLEGESKPIDSLTVAERMRQSDTFGRLLAHGGEDYFAELQATVVTVENIGFHAKVVKAKATARKLIEAAQEIAAHGYGEYGEIEEYLDEAERRILEVARGAKTGSRRVGLRPVLREVIRLVGERFNRKTSVTGIPSGLDELDELLAGFQPGELAIIAARPSMGKTALAMGILEHAAEKAVPGLVFSLEMSKESLVERMLAGSGGIDSRHLRTGRLDQHDWTRMTKAGSRLAELPIHLDDTGAIDIRQIQSECRRWRSQDTDPAMPAIVVVDYMQLVSAAQQGKRRESNREQEIAAISRGLKALAKELNVPVLALSQLNRGLESRKDKRPQLSDLRESGAIEQDADVVAFIYRDEVYDKESNEKGLAEIIVGKQRNGPVGTVRVGFRQEWTRFVNLASSERA